MDIPAKHAVRRGWIFFDLVRRGKTFFLRWFGRCFGRFFCGFGIVTSATPGAGGFGRNNHANMDATAKNLLNLQREEATLCEVYRRLAELEKDPVRRQTLVRIMHDERRHCAILKRRTGREMAPRSETGFLVCVDNAGAGAGFCRPADGAV